MYFTKLKQLQKLKEENRLTKNKWTHVIWNFHNDPIHVLLTTKNLRDYNIGMKQARQIFSICNRWEVFGIAKIMTVTYEHNIIID